MEMCRLERRRSRGREGLPPDGLVGDHGSSARLSMLLIDSATPGRRSRRDPGKVSKALRAQRMTPGSVSRSAEVRVQRPPAELGKSGFVIGASHDM